MGFTFHRILIYFNWSFESENTVWQTCWGADFGCLEREMWKERRWCYSAAASFLRSHQYKNVVFALSDWKSRLKIKSLIYHRAWHNCSSVDYQELTAICYLSNHHGEPTTITPGFSSAYLIGNLNGCGECSKNLPPPFCPIPEHLPPPPKCPGPEPTPPLPDLSCGNQGFGFAVYPNTVNGRPIRSPILLILVSFRPASMIWSLKTLMSPQVLSLPMRIQFMVISPKTTNSPQ